MERPVRNPIVHLELHTGDLDGARTSYERMFGWPSERIAAAGRSYVALGPGPAADYDLGCGIVECATARPRWLPYVEVEEVEGATARARSLGGAVLLEPREGPAGWRSVVALPAAGEVAMWQRKRRL
jgi:predicted enzyme related to lactoylglutathione lyase